MIEGKEYIALVKSFYSFLEIDFGFSILKETISGNTFYDIEYKNAERVISISYENIEDHLEVIVFILDRGQLPDYDDKSKTLHLGQLNRQILSGLNTEEICSNEKSFVKYKVNGSLEYKLLKKAKELRLCLKNFDKRIIK